MERWILSLSLSLLWAFPVHGLEGRVVLDGQPPEPREPLTVSIDQKACGGETVPDESLVLTEDGGVANVVVWIAKPPKTETVRTDEVLLDQVGCAFKPHVVAVQIGQPMVASNTDPVLHNAHAVSLENKRSEFNIAFPLKGQKIPLRPKKAGQYRIKCDAGHVWMSAYMHVFKHPYFGVTDETGHFEISDLPPGEYQLNIWHETLGTKTIDVKVNGEETAPIAVTLPQS